MARFLVLLIVANLLISSNSRYPPTGVADANCIKEYTVQQSSETCRDIALSNDIPLAALQSSNPTGNCEAIAIGDVLRVNSPAAVATPRPIFVEYILSGKMSDVPINSDVDFYFILAWAEDDDGSWTFTTSITPAEVEDIKAQHSNVKVMLGLMSDTILANTEVAEWVSVAVREVTSLVRQYHVDGIDIFQFMGDVTKFTVAAGELVRQLKGNKVISVASTFSYLQDLNDPTSAELWSQGLIDFVNLQPRPQGVGKTTAADYITEFLRRASQLGDGIRLTAGMWTETTCGDQFSSFTPTTVIEASRLLLTLNATAGINIFRADFSAIFCFRFEKDAQAMLAGTAAGD